MTRLLQENKQFSGVPAWIWDRRGFIVGRWQNADAFVGRRVPAQQLEQLRVRTSGVAKGKSAEGMELYYSYARSPVTGWTASVGAERAELDRAVRTGWIVGGALMVGGVLLGLLLALSIAARLRRSIVSLAAGGRRRPPPACAARSSRPRQRGAATSRRAHSACARARSSFSSTPCSRRRRRTRRA